MPGQQNCDIRITVYDNSSNPLAGVTASCTDPSLGFSGPSDSSGHITLTNCKNNGLYSVTLSCSGYTDLVVGFETNCEPTPTISPAVVYMQ